MTNLIKNSTDINPAKAPTGIPDSTEKNANPDGALNGLPDPAEKDINTTGELNGIPDPAEEYVTPAKAPNRAPDTTEKISAENSSENSKENPCESPNESATMKGEKDTSDARDTRSMNGKNVLNDKNTDTLSGKDFKLAEVPLQDKRPVTYMLRCSDNSLYTGWTNDPARRVKTHNSGKGGKYTRSRLPVTMVYLEYCDTKHDAMARERSIKKLTHAQKLALIESENNKINDSR